MTPKRHPEESQNARRGSDVEPIARLPFRRPTAIQLLARKHTQAHAPPGGQDTFNSSHTSDITAPKPDSVS